MEKVNKVKEVVRCTKEPLGHEIEGFSLGTQVPTQSNECSFHLESLILLIPDDEIAKCKKEGGDEKKNDRKEMRKNEGLSSFFEDLASCDEGTWVTFASKKKFKYKRKGNTTNQKKKEARPHSQQ